MDSKDKGMAKADQLIRQAERIRDTQGYRENLGYDQTPRLEEYLYTLTLTYADLCQVLDYYAVKCRAL